MFSFYIILLSLVVIIIVSVVCRYLFHDHTTIQVNGAEANLSIPKKSDSVHGRRVETGSHECTRGTETDLDIRKYADVTEGNFKRPSKEHESEEDNEEVHEAGERKPDTKSSTKMENASSRDAKPNVTFEQDELDEFHETKLTIDDDMKIFQQFVKKEELIKMMKSYRPLHGMCRYIGENIEKWKAQEVNIAITGQSGAGKSSLINTLRDIKPAAAEAARVGVTETTFERKKYTYVNNRNVVLWDLPGVGTLNFPKENYLEEMHYKQYDVFIIVITSRVFENDVWLAKELLSKGKRVLFCRTKIDIDLMNAEQDYPDNFDTQRQLSEIKDNIKTNYRQEGVLLENNVYLVSARKRDLYDFPKMDKELKGIINKKGITICKLIYALVFEYMEEFTNTLWQKNFTVRKFVARSLWLMPRNLYISLHDSFIDGIHTICLKRYGLDSRSLSKIKAKHKNIYDEANTKLAELFPEMHRLKEKEKIFEFHSFKNLFLVKPHLEPNITEVCEDMNKCVLHLVQLRLKELHNQLQVSLYDK